MAENALTVETTPKLPKPATRRIVIRDRTYELLRSKGLFQETFDDVITRLLDPHRDRTAVKKIKPS